MIVKKILSIIFLCIIFLESFLLSGCNKPSFKPPRQNEETTLPQDHTSPVSEPDTIKTINGMTVVQLYENFINEYTNADTYDISVRSSIHADGINMTSLVDLKLGENAMYIKADVADVEMECWFFTDYSYFNIGGEKYKATGATVDDIFGEGFVEITLSSALSSIDQTVYLDKLNEIQLHFENGEYYYTLKLTDKEAEDLGIGTNNYSETVFFDAKGKIRKIVCSSDSEEVLILLNAYGDTVDIALPADHDSYIEQTAPDDNEEDAITPPENAGCQDPLMYAEYEKIFYTLKNAKKFSAIKNANGSTELFYTKVENDEYMSILENNGYHEQWYIKGKGYACEDSGKAHITEVTAEFLSYFEAARSEIEFVCGLQLHGNDMADVNFIKDYSWADLIYSHNNNDGTVDRYEIRYYYDMSQVNIKITQFLNGEENSSVEYFFLDINSIYLENIAVPV